MCLHLPCGGSGQRGVDQKEHWALFLLLKGIKTLLDHSDNSKPVNTESSMSYCVRFEVDVMPVLKICWLHILSALTPAWLFTKVGFTTGLWPGIHVAQGILKQENAFTYSQISLCGLPQQPLWLASASHFLRQWSCAACSPVFSPDFGLWPWLWPMFSWVFRLILLEMLHCTR